MRYHVLVDMNVIGCYHNLCKMLDHPLLKNRTLNTTLVRSYVQLHTNRDAFNLLRVMLWVKGAGLVDKIGLYLPGASIHATNIITKILENIMNLHPHSFITCASETYKPDVIIVRSVSPPPNINTPFLVLPRCEYHHCNITTMMFNLPFAVGPNVAYYFFVFISDLCRKTVDNSNSTMLNVSGYQY